MPKVRIGNIFESSAHTVVNTVNCVGVMGKGIAKEFKERFPDMYSEYKYLCDSGKVKPGEPYIYKDTLGTSIINFPTKQHWRSPSRLQDIVKGLDIFIEKYRSWGVTSVAFPPLGCGNGGLEWSLVGPLMYRKLSRIEIPVEIYAPFGTPSKQMTPEFLSQEKNITSDIKGKIDKKINPEWITALEVLNILGKQQYARPVGRTIFQKICYILTEQGIDTGFKFKQGSYGPFSNEVKNALGILSNLNLVNEKQLGRMNALSVGTGYPEMADKHKDKLKSYQKEIKKTADLFSRIKNTEQAEEVTTAIYASIKVKKEKDPNQVSEKDVYDYILDWKKSWDKPEKKESLGSTIRNLEMLDWIKLKYSESLPASEI